MGNLDKVAPGQRIRSLPANDWNVFVDAARAFQSGKLQERFDGELPELSPVVVLIKNTTGTNLPRYAILGIAGPVSDPQTQPDEFRHQIVLVGVTPTEDHCGRFVILKDDIPDGFVGEAVIAGACLAKVLVSSGQEDFSFANILPGDTSVLSARVIGGARILWRESGVGTKWAVVRLADVPQAIVHFQLQADLVLGGSALASILTWNGSSWSPSGATILVNDWYTNPGMWQAYVGYRGLALKNACLDRYDIIWMETPARSIEFQLTENMGYSIAGQAAAVVTDYYLQGKYPGSPLFVFDAQANYRRALAGAKGKARWNDRWLRYEIVECNQMAIALACKLGYDMCSNHADGTLTGHTVLTFPPYGQTPNPLPGSARNYYHLAGRTGDWCLVLWDEDLGGWSIAQVQHHEIEVPIKFRYYQGKLQAKHRKIAVMYCEDETDWRDEITLVESEFVDAVRFTGCDGSGSSGGGGGTGDSGSGGSSGSGCGSIEYHTVKGYFFEPPTPQTWKNVLTFQEQVVLAHAAGSGNCITFQEVTVCTPCIGPADSTSVCATVTTTCTCQCNCNCDSGGSGGYSGGDSGGSGSSGNCACSCHASSNINFG